MGVVLICRLRASERAYTPRQTFPSPNRQRFGVFCYLVAQATPDLEIDQRIQW